MKTMKIAILSDIHANMEAFRAVLADIDEMDLEEVVCLGDNIGYGPEPEQVINEIREREIPTVMGNHELAVADIDYFKWFNPVALESLKKNIELLSNSSIRYISGLEKSLVFHGCRCVHGFPPSSPTLYQFQASEDRTRDAFEEMEETICFTGHTHILEIIDFDGNMITREPLLMGETRLSADKKYIVNIGSVGQPRDESNHAKYVVWDSEKAIIDVRFIPYDIVGAVNKILKAGLPRVHALRLL